MTPKFKLICQLAISAMVLLGYYAFQYALFFHAKEIDATVRDVLVQNNGAQIGAFGLVVGYWIGTSLSSFSKDTTINSQLTKGNGS